MLHLNRVELRPAGHFIPSGPPDGNQKIYLVPKVCVDMSNTNQDLKKSDLSPLNRQKS